MPPTFSRTPNPLLLGSTRRNTCFWRQNCVPEVLFIILKLIERFNDSCSINIGRENGISVCLTICGKSEEILRILLGIFLTHEANCNSMRTRDTSVLPFSTAAGSCVDGDDVIVQGFGGEYLKNVIGGLDQAVPTCARHESLNLFGHTRDEDTLRVLID